MKIEIHQQSEIERTLRVEMLETMFEVPATTKLEVNLTGELPLEQRPWNVGLIVGPSGSGKTLLLNGLFDSPKQLEWKARSVIDDFEESYSMEDISRVCQCVGFNTIPNYLRPFNVLSNGERFRVEAARRLLDSSGTIIMDEYSSVVDRQVAQFASHCIQKYVREKEKQFVAASCHYDIIDWLQPDWILEPGKPCRFTWRSLHGRPPIACKVQRVKYEAWELFREFHYMSQDLNKAARCYGLFIAKELCSDPSQLSGVLATGREGVREQRVWSEGEWGRNRNKGLGGFETNRDRGTQVPLERRESEQKSEWTGVQQSAFAENSSTGTVGTSSTKSHPIFRVSEKNLSSLGVKRLSAPENNQFQSDFQITSMCGVLHRPHPKVSDIAGFTRMVTLPDFQGLGLAFVLANTVASAYKALGKRLHSYPNHPAWIRSYQRSKDWMQVKNAGDFSPKRGNTSTVGGFGSRRCAVFCYIGRAMLVEEARKLVYGE